MVGFRLWLWDLMGRGGGLGAGLWCVKRVSRFLVSWGGGVGFGILARDLKDLGGFFCGVKSVECELGLEGLKSMKLKISFGAMMTGLGRRGER